MSTAEIIAELPRLSSSELAEVEAKIRELIASGRGASQVKSDVTNAHMRTPRLASREQSKDFVKHVVEIAPDAKL